MRRVREEARGDAFAHTSQSVGCVGGAKFWCLMMRDVRLKMFELPHFTWGIEIMNEGALFFGQR